jgi:hypothetical protein
LEAQFLPKSMFLLHVPTNEKRARRPSYLMNLEEECEL